MIKLGIIGCGGWGKNLLRNFQELPDSEVIIASDLVEKRLAAAKDKYPALVTTKNFREVVENPQVQAVIVATPGAAHFKIARDCLQAGKDVFVEKPMALASADCRSLIEVAEANKKILMVGHLLLYHPAVRKLKRELESGTIGELYYMYSQRLNLGKIRKSENAFWTFAPHDVSVALYLVGKSPLSVSARGESYVQEGIADVAFATITFGENVLAHVHVSWLDPHKVRRITVVGSKKMMVFDDMESGEPVRIFDKGVPENLEYDTYGEYLNLRYGDVHIPWVRAGEPLKVECEHFIESVRDRSQPLTDGTNGLTVVRVLEAAQKSMDSGGEAVDLE